MYEIKQSYKKLDVPGGARSPALAEMRRLIKEMVQIISPLSASHEEEEPEPVKSKFFVQYGIITEAQRESLIQGARNWQRADQPDNIPNDLAMWGGPDLIPFNRPTILPLYDFEPEEVDLEFEQLKELEAEAKVDEDEEIDTLKGYAVRLGEPLAGRPRKGFTEEKIKAELEEQDMWKIKQSYRGPIYRWMQKQLKSAILEAFRKKAQRHTQLVQQLKIGRWEIESNFLEQAKIVGMTTTGLSKNRGLIQSVRPKIVMIEEAAETLEVFVTAACMESLEHLILVGDHQQLRGHCSVPELEGYPWFLDVSMFERLVRHQVGHTQLMSQRRMIPEIRRVLDPIYKSLEDHPSVLDRRDIPGMGGVNSYFFVHDWQEDTDSLMSKINIDEAGMILALFERLILNGLTASQITILTYYNGQRKLILKSLKRHPKFQGCYFKVVTVDSYQGEENVVVILSLVRSNRNNNIGFLASVNRLCVALSRAQRGFYIFGNAQMLCYANQKWFQIVRAMAQDPRRVGFHLPLTCGTHGNREYVQHADDFRRMPDGGCSMPCSEELQCGHLCPLYCHSFPHAKVECREHCDRPRECGHPCLNLCFEDCRCVCSKDPPRLTETTSPQHIRDGSLSKAAPLVSRHGSPYSQMSGKEIAEQIDAFQKFAKGGHIEATKKLYEDAREAAAAEVEPKPIPVKKDTAVAVDEEALKKLQQADVDMASALFGDMSLIDFEEKSPQKKSADSPKKKGDGVELVRTTLGGRSVWKGTYDPMGGAEEKNENKADKKERGASINLLD